MPLNSLPSIDKEARVIKIARFSLAHAKYIFADDKISYILDNQNEIKTLTIDEILNLELAYKYILLEKLAYLCQNIKDLIKLEKLALKFAKSADTFDNTPIFTAIKNNKLFLEMCAEKNNYESKAFFESYLKTIEDVKFYINNIFKSLQTLELYDFNQFYKPSQILCNFENFNNASTECKKNFMKTMSSFAYKENLDEYEYAKRLEKYYKISSNILNQNDMPTFVFSPNKYEMLNRKILGMCPKLDDKILASALWSPVFMNLYFAENLNKNGKSIIKSHENNNSFMPYYKNYNVNLGVSIKNNILTVRPFFPDTVNKVELDFVHNGTKHHITILNSKINNIKLGNTILHGVTGVMLKDTPLEIEINKNFKEDN